MLENSKSEIQNPKSERTPNSKRRGRMSASFCSTECARGNESGAAAHALQNAGARIRTLSVVALLALGVNLLAAPLATNALPGDQWLSEYFVAQKPWEPEPKTLVEWQRRRPEYQRQLAEMLGLSPLPPRGDLKPVITGKLEHENIIVEKLHFQSLPGLYVTANLYRPKTIPKPAPTILYVCGHGPVITNGISYGNKVSYQHHGIWFARHGYVCLVIDTVQLGEIQGLHHGTYREGMWWWNSRGYTPAGVETWNGMRALDYLCTRPEVDKERLGVTGRSGGGAYSWFITAMDERIKVAAPVAGITDLQNHVIDGVVEGHCDCMFFVNTYRWDYPRLAQMAAPRPLLLVNTDADTIFPLDGVMRTHALVKNLYKLYNASSNLGLVIGPGPHKDTQNLQIPVFRWFNQHLKGEDPLIDDAAIKLFTPQQLKVFDQLPADAINTNIHALFVPQAADPAPPTTKAQWESQTALWMQALMDQSFAGWPPKTGIERLDQEPMQVWGEFSTEKNGVIYEIYSPRGGSVMRRPLRLLLMRSASQPKVDRVVLRVADESLNAAWAAAVKTSNQVQQIFAAFGLQTEPAPNDALFAGNTVRLCLLPRGVGPSAWSGDAKKQTQIRRRFMLLGQTLEAMRVWDIKLWLEKLRSERWSFLKQQNGRAFTLIVEAQGSMAVNVLYASLFMNGIDRLDLTRLPASHMTGPDYLNVLKHLDIPQTVAMAASRCRVVLINPEGGEAKWNYPLATARNLGWPADRLVVKPLP